MGHYTYLVIDIASICVPLIASFHPRLQFHRRWYAFWPACLISASVFVAWDMLYTYLGVWNFNPRYVTGLTFFNLPVEEVLFFICIPYASVFTYHCLSTLLRSDRLVSHTRVISTSLIVLLSIVAACVPSRLYTVVTFVLCSAMIFNVLQSGVLWLGQFYRAFVIVLIPFFIVNGLLTGTGLDEAVVRYNDAQNLGVRILTIPVEDIFYGMFLLLLNVTIYEHLVARHIRREQKARS